MKLAFDISKTYAVVLEGGGARGAYQVGAWRALKENGVKFNAVAGSSVGALNGAMMAMDDLALAENLWNDMKFSRVMDVDDRQMQALLKGKFSELDIADLRKTLKRIFSEKGIDVTPLRNLIKSTVDCDKIRNSPIRFFICTYSITDRKELELEASKLGNEELCDMLLASAYFPAFKHELLGGKKYTDGGVTNVLPLSPLVSRGYKDIISIRLYGYGIEKRIRLPKGTTVTEIAPYTGLGNTLNFDAEPCRRNYKLGYYDAMRMLYGLYGQLYYIDRTLSEKQAYDILCGVVLKDHDDMSLRSLHNELAKFCRNSGSKGDYYDVLVSFMESSAESLQIDQFGIYTDVELLKKLAIGGNYEKG